VVGPGVMVLSSLKTPDQRLTDDSTDVGNVKNNSPEVLNSK
jgi:hypothetical protein